MFSAVVLSFVALVCLVGCKFSDKSQSSVQVTNGTVADARVATQGVVRIRSVSGGRAGQKMSLCSGTLIHTPDQRLNACVVLAAAHCFTDEREGAQHTVEFVSMRGDVSYSATTKAPFVHPSFRSNGNLISQSMSAVDASLIKFPCGSLTGTSSSKILDYRSVPVGANLIVAGYGLTTSREQASVNRHQGLSTGTVAQASKVLMQTDMRLQKVVFPHDALRMSGTRAGVFLLAGAAGRSSCDGDSGGPVFFAAGESLFLVGLTSAGPKQCELGTAVSTIASPLVGWMNDVLGAEVIQVAAVRSAEPETGRSPSQDNGPRPSATSSDGVTGSPHDDSAGRCAGIEFNVQAVTRPWGTIIKLVDKDSSLVTDGTLKCNLQNNSKICVSRQPVATGTGHSSAILAAPVTADGCGKFTQGSRVYLYMPDFLSSK